MNNVGTLAKPALVDDLPAFFREDIASDPLHPVRALLEVFEDSIHRIEQQSGNSDRFLDPETVFDLELGPKEIQFLHWLASWVALELDQDWLGPADGCTDGEGPRHSRAVGLIKDAARLYRQRGTPEGFKVILERFYGREVEVLERSWPQGAQVGFCSSIGVDFWLTGEPRLENCFVLLIQPTESDRAAVGANIGTVESPLTGGSAPRKILWLLSSQGRDGAASPPAPGAAPSEGGQAVPGINDPWTATVDRIRCTVAREKPAHTCCYLGIPPFSRENARPALEPLVLAVTSTIGQFRIQ